MLIFIGDNFDTVIAQKNENGVKMNEKTKIENIEKTTQLTSL